MSASDTFDISKVEKAIEDDLPNDPTNPSSWSSLQLSWLLREIVLASNGMLDSQYADVPNAKELVKTHSDLRAMLVEAWSDQDYDEVLNSEILCKPSISSASSLDEVALMQEEKVKLKAAMSIPYRGVAVDALYEYLEHNERKFKTQGYYAKFGSVVQSSGTGKTRTILELADKGVLLLYMNFRPKEDLSGYPDRDAIPADILTEYCETEPEYFIRCCAFFAAIFKVVEADMSARLISHGAKAVMSWSSEMRELESQRRTDFFGRLEVAYNEIKRDILILHNGDHKLSSGIATRKVSEYFQGMRKKFLSVFPKGFSGPKLVIAFDEAHPLHEMRDFRRSTVIFRTINLYSGKRRYGDAVWVLFASTTSKVGDFASPEAFFDSTRISRRGQLIFPPFCEMGWDQHASSRSPNEVPPDEVAKAKHLLQYGRPLWVSLMEGNSLDDIFELVAQKLIASREYDPTRHEQALAVLSQRFNLNIFLGHRESIPFIETSIASHLRVVITTAEDRMWSYTSYPSEPLLSCAAVHRLHEDDNSLGTTFDTLKRKVDSGMIDKGQRGELVSRLLWLLAKDLFVIREKKSRAPYADGFGFDTELFHCSMIPVVDFFKYVFGEDFWSHCAGTEAETAFKDAYVNFSHWISMKSFVQEDEEKADDQENLNQLMMRHWQRTCAIQCSHYQPAVDKVIPIYFKSVNPGPGGADCMSQILISDKARSRKQSNALSKIQRTHPTIGGVDGSSLTLPYIAIVADLGLSKSELEVTWSSGRTAEAPRLGIRACALSFDAYPFLNDCDPRVFEALEYLIQQQVMPESERPVAQYLRNRVMYGESAEVRHIGWEKVYCGKEKDADTTALRRRSKNKEALKQAAKRASKKASRDTLKEQSHGLSGDGKGKRKAPENDDEEAMNIDG